MARRKNKPPPPRESHSPPPSPIQTRSRKNQSNSGGEFTVTTSTKRYTRIKAPPGKGGGDIQVISRNRVQAGPDTHARLMDRMDRLNSRRGDEDGSGDSNGGRDKVDVGSSKRRWLVEAVTNLNIFLYAACFFIQTGTLPYLTKKLGADSTTFGQLQTAFAVAQLLGGPIYGRMGDILGEKLALTVAFAAATSSYAMLGLAQGIPLVFISRVPSALMHVMQGSQMIMTDVTDEKSRAAALSRLGFSYGIGMVVGPTLGGHVNKQFGEQAPALVAAAGSLLSLFLVLVFVPNSRQTKNEQSEGGTASVLDFKKIVEVASTPEVCWLLVVKFFSGIPIGILQTMFSVIAMEQFNLPPDQNGYILSYVGIITLIMQGVGISLFTRSFSDMVIMVGASLALAISYFFMTFSTDVSNFIAVIFPMTCGLCLVNSVVTAAITKLHNEDIARDGEKRSGTLLGLNMAVHSVIRTAAPMLGGHMVAAYGFESIGYLGVVCHLSSLLLLPNTSALAAPKTAKVE